MDPELQRSPSWQTISGMVCLFLLVSLAVQAWHPPRKQNGRKVLGEPGNGTHANIQPSVTLTQEAARHQKLSGQISHKIVTRESTSELVHHAQLPNASISAEIRLFELVDLGQISVPAIPVQPAPVVASRVTPEFVERLKSAPPSLTSEAEPTLDAMDNQQVTARSAAESGVQSDPHPADDDPFFMSPSTQDVLERSNPAAQPSTPSASEFTERDSGESSRSSSDEPVSEPTPPNSEDAPNSIGQSNSVVQVWSTPTLLLDRLERLSQSERNPTVRKWARDVSVQIERLCRQSSLTSQESKQALKTAETLTTQLQTKLGSQLTEGKSEIWRRVHSVSRRLAILRAVQEVESKPIFVTYEPTSTVELSKRLKNVEQLLSDLTNDDEWRKYLLLHEIRTSMTRNSVESSLQRANLARRILIRMNAAELNDEQEELLKREPFAELQAELRRHATSSVDFVALLKEIEELEQSDDSTHATRIADAFQALRWSTDESVSKLANELDAQYRNANFRIAVSAEILNRMLPDPQVYETPVDDHMLGARVRGISRTISRLKVVLIPDRWQWRMNLEANGEVAAETVAMKGPAKLLTDAISNYQARKPVFIDRRGLRVRNAEAIAASDNDLRSVETDFDRVPLFGAIARSIAIRKHSESYETAKRLTENQVATRASQVFDQEVNNHLVTLERDFENKLLAPLRRLNLKPTAIDMETTADRLIVRYRLAGDRQLGSFTPRPRAPIDSHFSLQVHESALNNTLDNLKLSGRKTDLVPFVKELKGHFGELMASVKTDELPADVTLTFAKQDPLRVRFEDGRFVFVLQMAKVETRDGAWRNFVVRVKFKAAPEGQSAQFVSDGYELSGDRLGNRLGLRAVLSKTFPNGRKFDILAAKLSANPKLSDLVVNQFSVADGWIGIAIGPKNGSGSSGHTNTHVH